jgi:hypothetical protein
MPADLDFERDVRAARKPSRWGGNQPPRRRHVGSRLSQIALRPLDGHSAGGGRVSCLGSATHLRSDAEQLRLDYLFADYARLRIERQILLDEEEDARWRSAGSEKENVNSGTREQPGQPPQPGLEPEPEVKPEPGVGRGRGGHGAGHHQPLQPAPPLGAQRSLWGPVASPHRLRPRSGVEGTNAYVVHMPGSQQATEWKASRCQRGGIGQQDTMDDWMAAQLGLPSPEPEQPEAAAAAATASLLGWLCGLGLRRHARSLLQSCGCFDISELRQLAGTCVGRRELSAICAQLRPPMAPLLRRRLIAELRLLSSVRDGGAGGGAPVSTDLRAPAMTDQECAGVGGGGRRGGAVRAGRRQQPRGGAAAASSRAAETAATLRRERQRQVAARAGRAESALLLGWASAVGPRSAGVAATFVDRGEVVGGADGVSLDVATRRARHRRRHRVGGAVESGRPAGSRSSSSLL